MSGWKGCVDEWARGLRNGERDDVRHCTHYVHERGYPEVTPLQIGAYLGHHKDRLGIERVRGRVWEKTSNDDSPQLHGRNGG